MIGNTVIDALYSTTQRPAVFRNQRITHILAARSRILLVTTHRRESWGARMSESVEAIRIVAESYPTLQVILPMHRNTVVRDVIEPALSKLENVLLVEPLSYHEFATLLKACYIVLTDSGGVQEEAPSLGKPVLVMRDVTERPEAVEAGTVKLVGTDKSAIVREVVRLMDQPDVYAKMANAINPYGDGKAGPRAVAAITDMLGLGQRLPDFIPSLDEGR